MAAQSQCWWSWNRTSYSDPFTLSSPSSSSLCNSSFLHSFHTAYTKRHRFTACSIHHSSSSRPTPNSGPRLSTPIKLVVSGPKCEKNLTANGNEEVPSVCLTQIQKRRREPLSLKSLFEKRSLWRRILFASRKVRSIILLNVITIIYASNIPVVKEVEAIMDPAAFTVVRFTISAIPFIPLILQAQGDTRIRNAGIELGFWLSLGYLMQALGLQTSDAGRASFLAMFTVIVVPLLDGMLGAVIPARTWFGALMSIVGVGMLESSGSPPCVGDLLNFLSAVFFGIHMLRTEHISRSIKKENFLPVLGCEICVVALFSTIWYIARGYFSGIDHPWPSSWTWSMLRDWMVAFPWIPALYTGLFSTALCLWVEMAAMRDVSATETAIVYGLEPVWGAGFAWILLGERWGSLGWIGAALVLGGSLTVQIFGSSSPTESTEEQNRSTKDGKHCVAKEMVEAIDPDKNLITFRIIEGDLLEDYKTFKATLQASPKDKGSVVHWTLEYEKKYGHITDPHTLLQFIADMSKDIDAHLTQA
ncbi:hypothetical protein L6164_026724 [Bauhinia variegata]|uniref:Uncharacterized protein n=1 Tax=Bauhinia variegata TaxID=167791 RepID=A0ACB9LRE9_BAUVA|nr:hypothetical protein L6164_026724 [Bauhinia variegata]